MSEPTETQAPNPALRTVAHVCHDLMWALNAPGIKSAEKIVLVAAAASTPPRLSQRVFATVTGVQAHRVRDEIDVLVEDGLAALEGEQSGLVHDGRQVHH